MRRPSHLTRCLWALAGAAALAPGSASAKVELTADPELRPRFTRAASDYVSRCRPDRPLRLSVRATGGDRVAVGGRKLRGGSFSTAVHRATGESVSVRVEAGGRVTTHHVRCFPRDFPDWEVSRRGRPQAEWYVVTPIGEKGGGWFAIFDDRGVPVWWRRTAGYGPWDGKLIGGSTIAWTRNYGNHFGVRPEGRWEERRLDGRLVRTLQTVGVPTDTHDMQRTPDGNRLLLAYKPRDGVDLSSRGGPEDARVFDAEIQELTPAGKLVWRWNSKGHVTPAETPEDWWNIQVEVQWRRPAGEEGYDLVHPNSVEPDGDGVIVSARHLNAVFRVDKKSGAIDWKLGGRKRPESLAVTNHPGGGPLMLGQHDARLAPDGTLTVFDNGQGAGRPPYVTRFRIDPDARTATVLERFTSPEAQESRFVGSARKLPGGNWVVCWGGSPLVTEHTPGGETVMRLWFADNRWSYRAHPVLPGRLSARELRRGMSRMVARRRAATGAGR